jgi:amidohydrolase
MAGSDEDTKVTAVVDDTDELAQVDVVDETLQAFTDGGTGGIAQGEIAQLKEAVQRTVDHVADQLIALSDWMADHPEIGYQELQASEKLTELLDEFGVEVERGIADLPTAFRATLPGAQVGPQVGIIAEYDALPEVGHGCGHNIIATAATGAAIALSRLAGKLPGTVRIVGTPAEESAVPNAGGKIPLLAAGVFDGLDAALMIHPGTEDSVRLSSSLVAYGLEFEFHGHPAHAAANPHEGRNALDAMILFFSAIGLMRQQIRDDARLHGVIINGGSAPNVIPAYTKARFRVRAKDRAYTDELQRRVIACAEAAATATGTRMEWHEYARPYLNLLPNQALAAAFGANMEAIGRTPTSPRKLRGGMGSTDLGNVSHVLPVAEARLGICGREAGWHTKEVAAATKTERGHAAIVAGAKSIAMTAIDVLTNPALRERAWQQQRAAAKGQAAQ